MNREARKAKYKLTQTSLWQTSMAKQHWINLAVVCVIFPLSLFLIYKSDTIAKTILGDVSYSSYIILTAIFLPILLIIVWSIWYLGPRRKQALGSKFKQTDEHFIDSLNLPNDQSCDQQCTAILVRHILSSLNRIPSDAIAADDTNQDIQSIASAFAVLHSAIYYHDQLQRRLLLTDAYLEETSGLDTSSFMIDSCDLLSRKSKTVRDLVFTTIKLLNKYNIDLDRYFIRLANNNNEIDGKWIDEQWMNVDFLDFAANQTK